MNMLLILPLYNLHIFLVKHNASMFTDEFCGEITQYFTSPWVHVSNYSIVILHNQPLAHAIYDIAIFYLGVRHVSFNAPSFRNISYYTKCRLHIITTTDCLHTHDGVA